MTSLAKGGEATLAVPSAKSSNSSASEAILDAAEVMFGKSGFHGVSTRAIAERAKTNPALIHYYFGSKEALYQAAIARRATVINAERRALLAGLHEAGQPTLEDLLDALIRPTVVLGRDPERGGVHFARLLAHGVADANARTEEVANRNYDEIALVFIEEFQRAVPGLGRAEAAQGYMNTAGLAVALMVPNARSAKLSDNTLDENDLDQTLDFAIRFIAAGIRALANLPTP